MLLHIEFYLFPHLPLEIATLWHTLSCQLSMQSSSQLRTYHQRSFKLGKRHKKKEESQPAKMKSFRQYQEEIFGEEIKKLSAIKLGRVSLAVIVSIN
jgi:hypothetical protein